MINFKNFDDFFERLGRKWSESPVVQSARSIYGMIWNSLLIIFSLFIISLFFAIGTVSGYFAELVRNQPVLKFKTLEHDIHSYSESSTGYFAGNIPIGKMSSDLIRTRTQLQDISPDLIHAVIATEDEYFYQHHGVVPKGVLRATTEELLHKPQVSGGSTITQQLVKNQILTNEVSYERKAKEILLALRVERFFTKDQILEAYLNVATFGRDASGNNVAGVAAAAEGIFGVRPDKLNIPQAAYIAGLPKNPFVYSPFQNYGGVKKDFSKGINRAHDVLKRMYAAGYITQKQLDESLNYDYRRHLAKPERSIKEDYPILSREVEDRSKIILAKIAAKQEGYNGDQLYHDYLAYKNIEFEYNHGIYRKRIEEIAKIHGYSFSVLSRNKKLFDSLLITAEKELATGGYKVYTTISKPIYDSMQNVALSYTGYSADQYVYTTNKATGKKEIAEVRNKKTGKMEKLMDPMQVGSILIDNRTGKIISFVGGREFGRSQYNYAMHVPRQNGSTMKPLLVYAPAMELGLIQPGSIVADLPYKRLMGDGQIYSPTDYGGRFHGFETARVALAQSHNVPAVGVFTRLSRATDKGPEFLKKMGITTLVGADGYKPADALGGVSQGITVEENTNAYSTFANNGRFIDAYMIDKMVDSKGRIIYQHKVKPVRVFSIQTNYLMLDMMRDVFKYGTGRSLPGMLKFSADWAGKTGTSQDWRDSWLIGTNPNVTLGVWNGYAHNQTLNKQTYSTQTRQLWAGFANSAYNIDPELMDPPEHFKQPKGVVKKTFCGLTGGRVTELCRAAGFVKTDLLNVKYLPEQKIEALEPVRAGQKAAPEKHANHSPDNPGQTNGNEQPPASETAGFGIKPDFLKTHFPYIDFKAADPSLLGRIRN
ncbi:penicillin-binding protein [Sporolactobacillus sp. THM7-4]|nr:penicillin-binding protein [Sporolactobacillus sp. THM7-4]